jgi:hypothetical protein
VTFRQPRTLPEREGSGSTVAVTTVYGPLERVSGDTLFVTVTGALDERRRPVRVGRSSAPLAIAVVDAERLDAYRFSPGRTVMAVVGGLVAAWAVVMASACIMCGGGGGSSY